MLSIPRIHWFVISLSTWSFHGGIPHFQTHANIILFVTYHIISHHFPYTGLLISPFSLLRIPLYSIISHYIPLYSIISHEFSIRSLDTPWKILWHKPSAGDPRSPWCWRTTRGAWGRNFVRSSRAPSRRAWRWRRQWPGRHFPTAQRFKTHRNHCSTYPLVNQHSYWKWQFIVDFPLKMVIYHCYVKLPEGRTIIEGI